MKSSTISILSSVMAISLAAAFPGMAQDPSPAGPAPSSGWQRFQSAAPQADASATTGADPGQGPAPAQPAPPPQAPPSKLTIPAGTWVTIRVNEPLSSDRNQVGDAFFATLAQPLVVDGLVVVPEPLHAWLSIMVSPAMLTAVVPVLVNSNQSAL